MAVVAAAAAAGVVAAAHLVACCEQFIVPYLLATWRFAFLVINLDPGLQ